MAEASACGIPVVATNTGSINEVVLDSKTGFLVNPKSPEELSGAFLKLAGNPSLRAEMGKAGREYIEKNFSHEVVAEKLALQ